MRWRSEISSKVRSRTRLERSGTGHRLVSVARTVKEKREQNLKFKYNQASLSQYPGEKGTHTGFWTEE